MNPARVNRGPPSRPRRRRRTRPTPSRRSSTASGKEPERKPPRSSRWAERGGSRAAGVRLGLGGCRLAALAAGGLLLGGCPALLGARAGSRLLPALGRGVRGVGDPGRPLLRHALVLQGLILLLVFHAGSRVRHAAPPALSALRGDRGQEFLPLHARPAGNLLFPGQPVQVFGAEMLLVGRRRR